MTTLIPTNGGKNPMNGLDIKSTFVVVFDFDTLEILNTCENYTRADEIASDLFRNNNIDARTTDLSFFDESLNSQNIIGLTLNTFQNFVDNNNHKLIK